MRRGDSLSRDLCRAASWRRAPPWRSPLRRGTRVQVRPCEQGTGKVRVGQVRAGQVGVVEIRAYEVYFGEVNSTTVVRGVSAPDDGHGGLHVGARRSLG